MSITQNHYPHHTKRNDSFHFTTVLLLTLTVTYFFFDSVLYITGLIILDQEIFFSFRHLQLMMFLKPAELQHHIIKSK